MPTPDKDQLIQDMLSAHQVGSASVSANSGIARPMSPAKEESSSSLADAEQAKEQA